ncbi:DUF5376 family protein [Eikenella sp. S3360]|uniref:DUF5376 family protein n=1 Tax=Eikenella glucosivorans TaxID=2766967 RepID=A0ABS0NB67_9NEIS|nr:DUF5376 family protein [Eikenella glucosivorans]MBH5329510.1 DUF5376 family protein [Eikenella glucosivorans]
MKLIFRIIYAEPWKRYITQAISYHAVKYKVDGYPVGDSDFEEEKILGMYLHDLKMIDVVKSILHKLKKPLAKTGLVGSESWYAEIIDDKVKMQFGFASEDPEDEDYQPILFLPRKEVAYAMEKWLAFLQRDIDPNYSEIIDTEEAYL